MLALVALAAFACLATAFVSARVVRAGSSRLLAPLSFMVAAPWSGRLVMHAKNGGGNRTKAIAGDDVTQHALTFAGLGGDAFFYVPLEDGAWVCDDIIADTKGTDTSTFTVKKGGTLTENVIGTALANNLTTTPEARAQGLKGREFTPGNRYSFIQA